MINFEGLEDALLVFNRITIKICPNNSFFICPRGKNIVHTYCLQDGIRETESFDYGEDILCAILDFPLGSSLYDELRYLLTISKDKANELMIFFDKDFKHFNAAIIEMVPGVPYASIKNEAKADDGCT